MIILLLFLFKFVTLSQTRIFRIRLRFIILFLKTIIIIINIIFRKSLSKIARNANKVITSTICAIFLLKFIKITLRRPYLIIYKTLILFKTGKSIILNIIKSTFITLALYICSTYFFPILLGWIWTCESHDLFIYLIFFF